MGSLQSSMRSCLCCHWAGVVTLVAMVLPLLMRRRLCSPGIFAAVRIVLLLSLHWQHCHHQVIKLVLLPSSRWHCCHHPCTCIFTIVMVVLLPSLRQHHCQHWHCCPHCTDLFPIMLHGCCKHCSTSIVAPIELTCLRHCIGIVALSMLALAYLLRGPLCPFCAFVVQLIHRCLCPYWAGMY